ncbi:MAPEG family protein [Craterilacuibacter sp.]|uniref:MAPEG family protein n=1 Tax=Craterilacuibacter sp. TaxID=2870909 RepID=UPI003F41229C
MNFALWSLLLASVLPLLWAVLSKAGAPYDNSRPREVLARASGYRQRANWAQQNGWEAFAPWAAAVLVAQLMGVAHSTQDIAAIIFIAARLAHGVFYIMDKPMLRSLAWLAGFVAMVGLYMAAAMAGG